MSRRASGHRSVQLFPFLAVLVCVMGALIFLLLVTTQQLRQRAKERRLVSIGDVPPLVSPVSPSDDTPWQTLPALPEETHALPEEEEVVTQRQAMLTELENQQARLSQLQQAVAQQRLLSAGVQKRLRELEAEALQLERQRGLLSGQTAATRLAAPDIDAERAQWEQQIQQLRRRLKQLEDQQRQAQGQYAILPFEGKSGTTRKPIYIECTETGFRFLPENVVIRPADIEGFTERYNPLLAGAAALSAYWSQQATGPDSEPYVLLIVRPSGTVAYYIAQRLLARLKQPHGYELVPADMELYLPPVDPGAQVAVASAVARLLAEREQSLSATATSGARSGANLRGSGRKDDPPPGPGKFEISNLERNTAVGERSWEKIERFEGKEHRRKESGSLSSAKTPVEQGREAGASPLSKPMSPFPGEVADAGSARPGSQNELKTQPSSDAVTTAEYREADFPAFAPKNTSRGREYTLPYEQLQRRKWGQYGAQATIGLEHEVKVRVEAHRLIVDDAIAIPVPQGLSRTELFDRLLAVIDRRASNWGVAPHGFFWIPKLKFVVSPGGQQVYDRLAPLVSKSGLGSTTVHELEQ